MRRRNRERSCDTNFGRFVLNVRDDVIEVAPCTALKSRDSSGFFLVELFDSVFRLVFGLDNELANFLPKGLADVAIRGAVGLRMGSNNNSECGGKVGTSRETLYNVGIASEMVDGI